MNDNPKQMPDLITKSTKRSPSKLPWLIAALLLTPCSPALAQANDPFGGSDVKWPEPPGAFLNTKPQAKKTATAPPVSNNRPAPALRQPTSQWVTPAGQQNNWSQQVNSGQQAMPQEWQNELQQDDQSDSTGWQTQQSGFPQASNQNNGISSSGWITPQQNSQSHQPRQVRQVTPANLSQGAPRQAQAGSGQIQWLSDGANNASGNAPNYANNWSQEPQQQQSQWSTSGQGQQQQSGWVQPGGQQAIGQSGWVQPGAPQQANRNTSSAAPLFGEVLKQEQATQGSGGGIPGFTPALPGNQLSQGSSGIPGFNPASGASNIPGFTPATGGNAIQGFTPSNGMAELLQNIMPTAGNTIKLPNNRPMAAAQPMRRPAARSNSSIGGNINRTISRNVNRSINKMINKGFSSLRF